MTALVGLCQFPSYAVLKNTVWVLGLYTIFLFWAPMIKATRVWGGVSSQGKAFGFWTVDEIGRSSFRNTRINFFIIYHSEITEVTVTENKEAFKYVILVSTAIVAVVGLLVWFFMKINPKAEIEITRIKSTIPKIFEVIRLPSVGLLMIIILLPMQGYKLQMYFRSYAQDMMRYNQRK
jgi:hypothetical protein